MPGATPAVPPAPTQTDADSRITGCGRCHEPRSGPCAARDGSAAYPARFEGLGETRGGTQTPLLATPTTNRPSGASPGPLSCRGGVSATADLGLGSIYICSCLATSADAALVRAAPREGGGAGFPIPAPSIATTRPESMPWGGLGVGCERPPSHAGWERRWRCPEAEEDRGWNKYQSQSSTARARLLRAMTQRGKNPSRATLGSLPSPACEAGTVPAAPWMWAEWGAPAPAARPSITGTSPSITGASPSITAAPGPTAPLSPPSSGCPSVGLGGPSGRQISGHVRQRGESDGRKRPCA